MRIIPVSLLFLLSIAPQAAAQEIAGFGVPHAGAELLIPAAGSVSGGTGAIFRSEITIASFNDGEQRVSLWWLPRDEAGTGVPVATITIPPFGSIASDDFVREILDRDGLGSILIRAVDSNGEVTPGARLQATSRIWSPQPEPGAGTVSQSFPTLRLHDIDSNSLAILGARRSADYRTNVGIVNLDAGEHSFRITVTGNLLTGAPLVPEIYDITVDGFSMKQFPLAAFGDENRVRIDVEIVPDPFGVLSLWTAYGSTVDGRSNDAWSTIGTNVE